MRILHRFHGSLVAVFTLAVVLVSLPGCGGSGDPPPPIPRKVEASVNPVPSRPVSVSELIEKSDQLANAGKLQASIETLRSVLIEHPGNIEALARLANLEASDGRYDVAIELLENIPESHPDAGLPALGLTAEWCILAGRYADAEQKLARILELAPDAVVAHRQLAYLLNRQGRRQEAAQYVRQLCRLGDVQQDELHSLVVLSDAMYDEPSDDTDTSTRKYQPIGSSGQARRLLNQQRFDEAIRVLESDPNYPKFEPAVSALYGRATVEAQDSKRYQNWLQTTDDAVKRFADYWAAIGAYLLAECKFEAAARALGECVDRDPTDMISMGRLRQALIAVGENELAEKWANRWRDTRDLLRANNRVSANSPATLQDLATMADQLDKLHRPLEAVLWRSIAVNEHRPANARELHAELNKRHHQLAESSDAFPDSDKRLCGMQLSRYSLPDPNWVPRGLAKPSPPGSQQFAPERVSFIDVAKDVGIQHTFRVSDQPQDSGFTIYQFMGGAIAILDFDLNGYPDIYLGQGGATPPQYRGHLSNQFFRNLGGKFIDNTLKAGTENVRYTTGITAGDWNQDGFPDLVVSNIGGDELLINNGDGSFTSRTIPSKPQPNRLPSSVAVADVTGDSLPDLFQLAYVDDPELPLKPRRNEQGQVIVSLLPTDYSPGADRLLSNDGTGGFTESNWAPDTKYLATGLGLIITNMDEEPGNEIFIGNDLRPNQLWKRDSSTGTWAEIATPLGCGFGYTGGATASMGIATGDYDNNGTLDIHITNYQDDAASLFMLTEGVYRDRNPEYKLNAPSRSVLGFGTQSLDFDNDGKLDLIVTNGHIEDEAQSEAPFRQPPQLFRNRNGFFELQQVEDGSGYWNSLHLGRGLATLDFDQDGRSDAVVTHLESPTALLRNETISDGRWIQLDLIGTTSERDAIGAAIEIESAGHFQKHWVTAGDGYLASNQKTISMGVGPAKQIDTLTINWPSGERQIFRNVQTNQRFLIVENGDEPFPFMPHALSE